MPFDMDEALLSSPDPLNDSPTFSSPVKQQTRRFQKSLPLQGSSPTKQTFQLDVGNQLSPQKIRVTVEAEHPPAQNEQKAYQSNEYRQKKPDHVSPARQNVRTTTTIVPVKGLSDTEEDTINSFAQSPKRGRGRPRNSIDTPAKVKSRVRTGTPAGEQGGRRRRTLGDLVDGDDPDDWDFTIGAGVELGRGKGRARSRSTKRAAQQKSTPAAKPTASPHKAASSTSSRQGRGRRKTLTPEEILIHEDEVDALQKGDVEKRFLSRMIPKAY